MKIQILHRIGHESQVKIFFFVNVPLFVGFFFHSTKLTSLLLKEIILGASKIFFYFRIDKNTLINQNTKVTKGCV